MKPIPYWTVYRYDQQVGKGFCKTVFRITYSDPALVYFYPDHSDRKTSVFWRDISDKSINIINLKNYEILKLIRLTGSYLEANQIRPEHAEILLDLLNAELLARLNRKKQKVNP